MKRNLLFTLLFALLLTGCGAKPEVKDVTVEAGSELSTDVTNYAIIPEGIDTKEIVLNLEEIDVGVPGNYSASITYKNKTYEFTVDVVDTTAPTAKRVKDYTICQPGVLTASDYITDIEDITNTEVGFLKIEKREDLYVMTDDELLEDSLKTEENNIFTEDMSFDGTVEIAEDGIYDSEIAVKDEAGNMKVFGYTFYVDGTAPEIANVENQEMEINSEDGYFEVNLDSITVIDNFDGDIRDNDQTTGEFESNGDGTETTESFTLKVTSVDRAGNSTEKTAVYKITNTYAQEQIKKELAQIGNEMKKYSETQTNNANQNTSTLANGLNRADAESAFALMNQQRENNGLPALMWNESLYEIACTRAQEITTSFSHTRPNGLTVGDEYGLGENIAVWKGVTKVINAWMNSDGHRENILRTSYTNSVMACYNYNGNQYWVNLFSF